MASIVWLACSCSGGGGNATPSIAVLVVATSPANGAIDVAPASEIRLTVASAESTLTADDVLVRDGGNRLRGTVQRLGPVEWAWVPDSELPRGATIQLGTAQQGLMAAFTVRDYQPGAELEVPLEQVTDALCWTNGRRAVRMHFGRVIELTAAGSVDRLVQMPIGARAFGDGAFLGEEVDFTGARYCIRGNLDGTRVSVPTPLGQPLGDHNQLGDVVVLVPGDVGTPAEQGLWRLAHDAFAFELVGPLSVVGAVDEPSIESNGTVSIAWVESSAVHLARFAKGDLAGERHQLLMDGANAHFDAGDDGRGVLALGVFEPAPAGGVPRYVARAARFQPGVGLQLLPQELRSWGIYLSPFSDFRRVQHVRVGDLGSACVTLAYGSTTSLQTNTNFEVVRIEPDDAVGGPTQVTATITTSPPLQFPFGDLRRSPRRAEVWGISSLDVPGSLFLVRSRPDGVDGAVVFDFLNDRAYSDWHFALNDSGRGLLAIVEIDLQGFPLGTRIRLLD